MISIIVFIDDGSPIIIVQKRVGLNRKLFNFYKFRTMKLGTPDLPTILLNNPDEYHTRIGRLLRKFSIDELPQLLNIIKGDMVFVGPRPVLPNEIELTELRNKKGVLRLKPGLTGWAQVNGRDDLSIPERVNFDELYLQNKSFLLDLKIIYLTIWEVFKGNGTVP